LPKSTTELDLMEWQGKSYGAQIILHRMWIADFDRVLREIATRARGFAEVKQPTCGDEPLRPRLHQPPAQQTIQPTGPASDLKTCPMCAESVQSQARICRYCRYSFDEQRLLPSA